MRKLQALAALAGIVLTGCAGFGIVATSDPLAKLRDAEDLYARQYRPLPAERLIREAMAIYEERDDPHGLGHAHRNYGDFLGSAAVLKWEALYRRDGFLDKTISFDNRKTKALEHYSKALEYYRRAEKQHQQAQKYDALTNVYYSMAWSHFMLDENDKACFYYDQALGAYHENIRRNPNAKPFVPSGYRSISDLIESAKRRTGCQSA
jgi:tetratricopeptide (TPR) repeat protein